MSRPNVLSRCHQRMILYFATIIAVLGVSTIVPVVHGHSSAGVSRCGITIPFNEERHKRVYKVGVLAIRGVETAFNDFNKTFADYLTSTAGQRFDPPIRFEMEALNFVTLFTSADNRAVDYIYVNPSAFSCIESEYGAQSLASQISRRKVGGNIYDLTKFGGVIATRADNHNINSISDLKDKVIAAASISGLGSGQMQFKQMIDSGMDYVNDPKQLVFTSNQGKVVNGLLNGEFDVGFVRTDQIERSKDSDGNLVNVSDFKIIDPKPGLHIDGDPFPFESSTSLYPEWNIAALTHVPGDVSVEVQNAMLALADHADIGAKLQQCRDTHNGTSYCDSLDFPLDFANETRCDTNKEVAEIALAAKTAGKYAGWRTTLSYMQLRTMQESTGFISFNKAKNTWSCVRIAQLYDAVTCPEGTFLKSKSDFDKSCAESGLQCKDGYKCICSPCFQPLVCEGSTVKIFNRCVTFGTLFASVIVPVLIIIAITVHIYVRYKKQKADCVWRVNADELKFGQPPEIIGRGTFGIVVLAEYRGTNVAVKRVIPPKSDKSTWYLSKPSNAVVDPFAAEIEITFEKENDMQSTESIQEDVDIDESDLAAPYGGEVAKVNKKPRPSIEQSPSTRSIVVLDKFLQKGGFNKIFDNSFLKSGRHEHSRLKADFIREMRHLSKLRHPCITTVMGAVISNSDEPMLVMEYMNYGSLYDMLHNESMVFEGRLILQVLRDIANGIRFLHMAKPQVIHGDLKAQNILVDSRFHAKVADFGLSQKRRFGVSGTPYWMAPELLRGESRNSSASDVYSLGIILYELYSRKEPYEGEDHDNVLFQVCSRRINKRPPVPAACPPVIAELMKQCLHAEPEKRPTIEDIDLRLELLNDRNVEPQMQVSSHNLHANSMGASSRRVLYDVFPKHIADSLARGLKVEPEHHDLVTIFFSDVVGFTDIAGTSSPIKVSDMLDRLYSAFDKLAIEHGVFKIETAGDSYMGVTNLVQNQSNDHVKRIAEFAIDAINIASKTLIDTDDPDRGYVRIRVGFHSGPVVSNVVGSLNPKFGIFGDTVNISSRMESTCVVGKMQCSSRSAELLMEQAPDIPIALRGEIEIKGKGEMTTYWVNNHDMAHRRLSDF